MAGYDGSIKINTEINTKDASSQMMSLENRIAKTTNKVDELKKTMDSLSTKKVDSKEFLEIEQHAKELNKELEKMRAKRDELIAGGAKKSTMAKSILNKENQMLQAEMVAEAMRANGQAFTMVDNTDSNEYQKAKANYDYAKADLDILNKKHEELVAKEQRTGEEGAKAMRKISESSKKSGDALSAFGKRITGLIKNVFIFSLITKALGAMRSALANGFSEFAKYSSEYNNAMENFRNSTATLGNSIVGAIAPLIEVAMPYITRFIDFLTRCVEAVSKLIAGLTGKSTWTRAKKQNASYNNSLGKTAKTAKKTAKEIDKVTKSLASYDRLNNITTNKDNGNTDTESPSSVGAGTGTGSMWEEVPLTEKDMKWIERIKNLLKSILPIVIAIGTALAGWKFANWLADLVKAHPILGKILAIISLIAGAIMLVWSYFDMWVNGINWKNLAVNLAGTVLAFAGIFALFGKKPAGIFLIVDGLMKIVTGIKDVITNGLNMKNATIILMGSLELLGGVLLAFGTKWIPAFGTALKTGLIGAFSQVPQIMSMGMTSIMAGVQTGEIGVGALGATIGTTLVAGIFASIVGFKLGEKINEWLTGEKIDFTFKELMQTIRETLSDGTFKDAMKLWGNDIKSGLSAMWKDITDWCTKVKEAIKNAFSNFKSRLSFTGGGVRLNTGRTSLPHMATGGVTVGRTIAEIGEAGKEAVLPLERNTEWMDMLANKLQSKVQVEVIPIPDESGIFKSVQKGSVKYTKATRKPAFA